MRSLPFAIALALLLSATSLLVIVFRVSPILSPTQALPSFFVSLFLAVSSASCLLLYGLWKVLPIHAWDEGKILSISLRQGMFIGTATLLILTFFLLSVLTWWIAVMIVSVFVFIELALEH